jgi:prephenate dehydratase
VACHAWLMSKPPRHSDSQFAQNLTKMTQSLKFGFQGHANAHSHVAIQSFIASLKLPSQPQHPLFPRTLTSVECLRQPTLQAVFEQLQSKAVDYAMLPIENTLSGTFPKVYDLLLQYHQNQVYIVGEFVLHEENSILISSGTADASSSDSPKQLEDITHLYSHTHVLEQCSCIIKDLQAKRAQKGLPPLQIYATDDSAGAAQMVSQMAQQPNGQLAAAIAHRSCQKTYKGLVVLKDAVEDDLRSATRYLILGRQPLTNEQLSYTSQMGTNKTSIAAIVKNQPGMLFKTLGYSHLKIYILLVVLEVGMIIITIMSRCFAMRDINISKMESRPSHRAYSSLSHSPWEYINYVDIEGGLSDERVRNALQNVGEYANETAVFGSYPRYAGVLASDQLGGAYGG